MSRYQKGKTNLDFNGARDSEWQWHQLGHMQVCTSLQTDNHASTPPLSFLQAGCPSCRPTNSVKALKAMKEKTQKKTPKRTKLSSDTGSHVVNGKLMLQPKNRSTYQCPGINFTLEIQQQFSHLHIATMSSNMQRRQIVLTQCTHKWTLLTSTLNKLWRVCITTTLRRAKIHAAATV